MDTVSFEYFYWEEESNRYQWTKPELYVKKTNLEELFKEGEEIMFRFPGRRTEEIATIVKVRFDDSTGADMYDIKHRYNPDLICKWISRMQIKQVPKEGDALKLSIMEKQWKRTIKKKRKGSEILGCYDYSRPIRVTQRHPPPQWVLPLRYSLSPSTAFH
jgi:hypothetical protein